MIKKLKLKNFRNFEDSEFFFGDNLNYIIGENGKGKTNILEALSLLTGNSINNISFDNLTKNTQDFFHIEIENHKENNLVIFYDKKENKKKYSINKKNTTKFKFKEISLKSVIFSPITMNLFFLGPSLRRDFLDQILLSSFPEYDKILKDYKKSLLNRNKILKNISLKKSDISEIDFWNDDFVKKSIEVYKYRKLIINFLEKNIENLKNSFGGKIKKIDFKYNSKISQLTTPKEEELKKIIKKYLSENLEKEIILKTTTIGPHRDDFEIILDEKINLVDFASRGEIKTIILGLKKLEIDFIEVKTTRKPILIIDDLLSELDENHKNIFLDSIQKYQTFMSGIRLEIEKEKEGNLIKL